MQLSEEFDPAKTPDVSPDRFLETKDPLMWGLSKKTNYRNMYVEAMLPLVYRNGVDPSTPVLTDCDAC